MSTVETPVNELDTIRTTLIDYIKRSLGNRVLCVHVGSELYNIREAGLYDPTYTNWRRLTWETVDWTRLGVLARHLQDNWIDDPIYLVDNGAAQCG